MLAPLAGKTAAEDLRTASLTPGSEDLREADLPTVLTAADAARYRHIFELQNDAQWSAADHEIAALQSKLLLGSVLAQRYLHARYRPNYPELAAWLQHYADEPDAKAIYALALRRHPGGAPAPTKPVLASLARAEDGGDIGPQAILPANRPEAAPSPRAENLARVIRGLAASEPRRAELALAESEAKRILDSETRAELRTDIAEGYLATGQAQEALTMSSAAQDAAYAPVAHWNAGLAAWRLGRLGEARDHFEALARSPEQSPWTKSAAAFWAARVELRTRRPQFVSYWLGIAAEEPRTFYGLVARRLLGVDTYLNFDADPFTEFDARIVGGMEPGRRALALIEAGQRPRAEHELEALAARGGSALLQSLEALADRANLPGMSLQIAGALGNTDGRYHDYALYPVPRWTPRGGFSVDRALLFGLMRQESLFLPKVRSGSGALGLMQLMPATARAMAARAGVTLKRRAEAGEESETLADPELNLTLAQEYVQMLLNDEHIKGNLLLFAAAYNGGPAAAQRWQSARPEYRDDPLLFLESIPSRQARVFTQRVLTNYWIYRQRLGQPVPDLDALAAGDWPIYTALDSSPDQERLHAENR